MVFHCHRVGGLARRECDGECEFDAQCVAEFGCDTIPDEGCGMSVCGDVQGRERLLFAVDGVVARAKAHCFASLNQPPSARRCGTNRRNDEPKVGAIQDAPAGFDGGQADKRTGFAVKFEAECFVFECECGHWVSFQE